jgi:HSP20 family protein
MSLIRYEGNPIANVFEELNDLMSGGLDWRGRDLVGAAFPRVDITESKDAYLIKADLPGMTRDEIKVNVEEGVLSISGEKKSDFETANKDSYYHFERRYGKFIRSFSLPSHVDSRSIEARYTNGVLEINLKKTEESKPKAIEVKVE